MSMRRIKVGDTVQAFLDANIKGEVMQIEALSSAPWLVVHLRLRRSAF